MNIWYDHSLYKTDGLKINKISHICYLRHVTKVASMFKKMFMFSFKYANKESGKT